MDHMNEIMIWVVSFCALPFLMSILGSPKEVKFVIIAQIVFLLLGFIGMTNTAPIIAVMFVGGVALLILYAVVCEIKKYVSNERLSRRLAKHISTILSNEFVNGIVDGNEAKRNLDAKFQKIKFPICEQKLQIDGCYDVKIYQGTADVYFILAPYCFGAYIRSQDEFSIHAYNKLRLKKEIRTETCKDKAIDDEVQRTFWTHTRKDGGPDMRYNDNQLYYVVYRGEIILSYSGKSASLPFSNKSKADNFELAFDAFVNYVAKHIDSAAIYP